MSASSTSSSRRSSNSIASNFTLPVRSPLPPARPSSSSGLRTASPYSVSSMFPANASNCSSYASPNYPQGGLPYIGQMFYVNPSRSSGGYLNTGYSQGLNIGGYASLGSAAGLPRGLHAPSIGQTFPSTPSAASYMSGQEHPQRWPFYGYQAPQLPPPNGYEYQPHWYWRSSQELPSTQVEDQSRWGWRSSHELPSAKVNDQPDPLNKGKAHELPPENNDNNPRWGWRK